MEAYTGFAEVYDLFMDNVPYREWGDYLVQVFQKYGIGDGLVLDLGCGTGKMTRYMAKAGYDMIGVDNSVDMLEKAKEADGTKGILYLLQDMREFELYGTVRAVYSVCDCVNYILEEEELLRVFRLVNNYLDPQGLFVFDINSPFRYEGLLSENTFAENREEGSFIWENYYDRESRINEYDLTLFIREEENGGRMEKFLRFQEVHYQRCYTLEEIIRLIRRAGMEFVASYDAYTFADVGEKSEKITVIAREKGKNR